MLHILERCYTLYPVLPVLQFSGDGRSIIFVYRIGMCPKYYGAWFRTYMFTIDVDGHNLWRLPSVEGAVHNYGSDGRILIGEKVPPIVDTSRYLPPDNAVTMYIHWPLIMFCLGLHKYIVT